MSLPQGNRILIVDDDPVTRDTIRDLLDGGGYRVETADSGLQALKLLEDSRFDLVISDLVMPGMDGISMTRKVKETGTDIPIIVITGFATIEHAVESMKAGAYDFITKPFNTDQIRLTVEKALEKKKLQELASEREFYKRLSNSDELTTLANYRYFNDTLQKEIDRSFRYNRPLSLIMLDIDDFKNCNDTYGHLVGDAVLKKIAMLIKKNTRGSDFEARYGGEEFAVILPETDEEEARIVAERIRQSIDSYEFTSDDGKPMGHLSVTIGLASIPKNATNKKDLVRTADLALYSGKASGKNCVIVYTETRK